jgi:aminodeoxyfutalosine deaminase
MTSLNITRARCIVPITRAPIHDGAIVTRGEDILAVDTWKQIRATYQGNYCDLGDQVLLPGLVNAHCHLEYSSMAQVIPPPKTFTQWIQSMVHEKKGMTETDYANSWMTGYQDLAKTGTTTVADMISQPQALFDNLPLEGSEVIPFFECIHLQGNPFDHSTLDMTETFLARAEETMGVKAGIAPHAPFTTTPILWEKLRERQALSSCRYSMHLAESRDEFDLFQHGNGPLHAWLKEMHHLPCWGDSASPVKTMATAGVLRPGMLLVHANKLTSDDIGILTTSKVSIVHCPRSHLYFGHPPFPYHALARQGINIALGTDSLASMRCNEVPLHLNLFQEMRQMLDTYQDLSPDMVLRMGTLHGAKALNRGSTSGSLEPGKQADWISLPWQGSHETLMEHIIFSKKPPGQVVIKGHPMAMESN